MTTVTFPPAVADGDGQPGRCRYPGCGNPARPGPGGAGRKPGYCGREVPEDRGGPGPVLVAHTALSAFRRRQQLAGQAAGSEPVTAAISAAAAVRDDAMAAVTRLGGQLTAAIDQLAAIAGQLAAAGDAEAAEAQAEAVRAEADARAGQARAEAAASAAARHAADAQAAEARAAAAEAITAMQASQARAEAAEAAAARAAAGLEQQRAEAAAAAAAAGGERDQALAEAAAAARQRDDERQRHQAEAAAAAERLAAAADTITALRGQLERAEQALDRERDQQHQTVALLRGLIARDQLPGSDTAGQPGPASAARAGAPARKTGR